MSGKKLVDFIEEYISDRELLSELAEISLDDIKLDCGRRELLLFCSSNADFDSLAMKSVEGILVKKLELNAASIACKNKKCSDRQEEFKADKLYSMLVDLRKKLPAVNGFLNDAECIVLDDTIRVILKSGSDVVNNLGAAKIFSDMISERFGLNLRIHAPPKKMILRLKNISRSWTERFYIHMRICPQKRKN